MSTFHPALETTFSLRFPLKFFPILYFLFIDLESRRRRLEIDWIKKNLGERSYWPTLILVKGWRLSRVPGFEDVHKSVMCGCASLLLADSFFFFSWRGRKAWVQHNSYTKCFPLTFAHILVTAWLTRARSVVVELYLPFCGLRICKQAACGLNWGHRGRVLGWCNQVTPFPFCGSSLAIFFFFFLCGSAASVKRPQNAVSLGEAVASREHAGLEMIPCVRTDFPQTWRSFPPFSEGGSW